MEAVTSSRLSTVFQNLQSQEPLPSFIEETREIRVILHASTQPEEITLTGLAPFHTIDDLIRAIWLNQERDEDFFPKFQCLLIRHGDDAWTPANRTWYSGETEDASNLVPLGDPETVIRNRSIQTEFVDEAGERRESIRAVPRGRVTLESAFLQHGGSLPEFHCYTLSYLSQLYTGLRPLSPQELNGLFVPYFPSVTPLLSTELTEKDRRTEAQIQTYITAKLSQLEGVQQLAESVSLPVLRTSAVKKITLQWPQPIAEFEGADVLFYGAPVNELRPYMRLLTPNTTPMTKLYQPDISKPPQVNDSTLLRTWTSDRSPVSTQSVLFIKTLLQAEQLGTPPIYATLRVYDDATADATIQPPKALRVLQFGKELVDVDRILSAVIEDMPFVGSDVRLDKADLVIEYDFKQVAPRTIRKQILTRLAQLSTFFLPVVPPKDETGRPPLICLRYKPVSNFYTTDRVHSFIAFLFQRNELSEEFLAKVRKEVAKEFELTEDEAGDAIKDYITKQEEVTVSDPDNKEFTQLYNAGTDIAIYSQSVSSFVFHIYNLQNTVDLLRICTLLSLVMKASDDDWDDAMKGAERESEEDVSSAEVSIESASSEEEMAVAGDVTFVKQEGEEVDMEVVENIEFEGEAPIPSAKPPTVQEAADAVSGGPRKPVLVPKPTLKLKLAKPKLEAAKPAEDMKIKPYQWYITRLQRLDPALFNYKSEGAGVKPYSTHCQANVDRQPAVFTQDEYQRIRELYSKDESDGRVGFIVYGVRETDKTIEDAKGKTEQITVLKYGSNPAAPNFYICPALMCLRDVLPILKEDFNSTKDRSGKPKPEKSCPFCHGRLIKDLAKPGPNEVVLKRAPRPASTKLHTFVGFLGSGKHPKGFELPCCFAMKKNISWSDARFKIMREASKKLMATKVEEVDEEEAEEEDDRRKELEQSLRVRAQQIINYERLRYTIGKEYIVGSEKYPLEPGKVGLPSLALDAYFAQDSTKMVERPSVKMEFVSNARGMFRIGVFNKAAFVAQSLFAALAPLLGKNTIPEVVQHLKTLITPRVFLNLNFGNLLLEFFDPTDEEPSPDILNSWATIHLQIYKPGTEPELSRFYRSYNRFIMYLEDPTQTKQLRHFVHALAEPGLLTPNGLNILVIEYLGDPRNQATQVEVSCPLLGVDTARYVQNDIGFLTHSSLGVWEPLVFVDRVIRKETVTTEKEGFYTLPYEDIVQPSFPDILRARYLEYLTKCSSSYRGAFTFQSYVDSRVLLPVTKMLEILQSQPNTNPTGLVRDSFNHLIAVTVKNPYSRQTSDVLVPVVDDGNSFHYNTDLKIHVGLQSIQLATADDTYKLYTTLLMPLLVPLSAVYTLTSFIRTVKLVAFRLGGADAGATILLPCREEKKSLPESVPIEQRDPTDFQFEYEINRELLFEGRDEEPWRTAQHVLERDRIEDIYEHLRISFANWVATNPDGSTLRSHVEKLLEMDLPSFEKIRRLQLEYQPMIESWLAPDADYVKADFTLLRRDCISISNEEKCTGTCVVRDGKCKIHTPSIFQLGLEHRADAVEYLCLRLFDEIVRLPARRHELMTKSVKRVHVPRTNLHVGSEWILPENVPAWYDLLREQTSSRGRELPRYYEEFSRLEDSESEQKAIDSTTHIIPIPEALAKELPEGADKVLALRIVGTPEENSTRSILRYLGMERSYRPDLQIDSDLLGAISKKYKRPVVSLNLAQEPMGILGRVSTLFSLKATMLVMIPEFEAGPAVLVVRSTLEDSVPAEYIQGRITNSIERVAIRLKKVPPKTVAKPTPKPSIKPANTGEDLYDSNSNESVELSP
jgi:hypothetical protein